MIDVGMGHIISVSIWAITIFIDESAAAFFVDSGSAAVNLLIVG